MTFKLENVDPPASTGIAPIHNSGSFRPIPGGAGPFHDPRQGGEVRPGNFVPPSQGGQDR
jgi:hypothetical protein